MTKIEEDDNYNHYFGYRRKELALTFLKCNYTNNEIKEYLDACSRQAYNPDYVSLSDTYKICEIANVPMVKIPREMHVFYKKMDSLDRFCRNYPNYIDIIKTAFEQKHGQEFLDKLMYYCYKKGYTISRTKKKKILVVKKSKGSDNEEILTCYDNSLNEISIEEAMKLAGKGLK